MKTNKICVIICEYNPLHNGHKLLIDKARQLSGCDFVACVMSGNFSQRGNPCILDKHSRAHLALQAGADIVLQMPTVFACSSAEVFARGGVNIANSLKNATHLIFGSECGDIDKLDQIATFFVKEPKEYKIALKKYLDDGYSFPQSRQKAIADLAGQGVVDKDFAEIINSPNNILGIEYLKALKQTKSKIIPLTIKREGEDYNSKNLSTFPSASAIRELLTQKNGLKQSEKFLPPECFETFKKYYEKQKLDYELFEYTKMFMLKTASLDYLKNIFDVTEGLENRLHSISRETTNYADFEKLCKTKRFSSARLNRVALASILGITKDLAEKVYTYTMPYIKPLAIKRNKVMSALDSDVPIVIRNSDIPKLNNIANKFIEVEDRSDSLYGFLTNSPTTLPYLYQTTLIINH